MKKLLTPFISIFLILSLVSCSKNNSKSLNDQEEAKDKYKNEFDMIELLGKIQPLVDEGSKSDLEKLCKDKKYSLKARLISCSMAYSSKSSITDHKKAIDFLNQLEELDEEVFFDYGLGTRATSYAHLGEKARALRDADKSVSIKEIEANDLYEVFKKNKLENGIKNNRTTWEKILANDLSGFNKEQKEILTRYIGLLPNMRDRVRKEAAKAYTDRASIFITLNEREKAISDYESALKFTPSDQRIYEAIEILKTQTAAVVNLKNNNVLTKKTNYQPRSSTNFGKNTSGIENRPLATRLMREGLDAYNNGNINLAVKKLTESLEYSKETGAYIFRGRAYQAAQQYQQAMNDFNSEISHRNNFLAYFYRGVLNFKLEKNNEAISDMDKCLKQEPDSGSCLTHKGYYQGVYGAERNDLNLMKQGLQNLNIAISKDKNYATAYNFRAMLQALLFTKTMQGEYMEGALKDTQIAVNMEPDNQEFHNVYNYIVKSAKLYLDLVQKHSKAKI